MKRELVTLVESDFSRLEGDDIHICKIGGEVDPMWGMNCILLSKEQINALLNGDCVWLTDGEYATVLRAEQTGGGRVMGYDELMQSILTAQEQMLKHSIEANSVTLNGRKYGKLIENLPPNIKPTIFGMSVKADYAIPDDYDFLVQYEPPKPKSNADRIRAMTDEELAKHLVCEHTICTREKMDCNACMLDWLQEEVKDDEQS